jgi:hypothetical protein
MPSYIVNPLWLTGTSIVLSSADNSNSLLAQQLAANIAAGTSFLGTYPTTQLVIPVQILPQTPTAAWEYRAMFGPCIFLAGTSWRDPNAENVWNLALVSGSTYTLQIAFANLFITLNKSGSNFSFVSSVPNESYHLTRPGGFGHNG